MFKYVRSAASFLKCKPTINIERAAKYATKKRFYKNTSILHNDGRFEITLDQRKLKTPAGNPFFVESEPLALAISSEWDSQKDVIQQSSMHLTALSSTVLDNPNKLSKIDITEYLINYLTTDTLIFQSHENDALYEFQQKEWDPIIQWFCDRFAVNIDKVRGLETPVISSNTRNVLSKHLMSYNFAAINGYMFGVDTLKSVILMLATVERQISTEKAVFLSRLEEEFQCKYWERVEWSHDMSQQELQTRLSAAVLFVYFNSTNVQKQFKNANF